MTYQNDTPEAVAARKAFKHEKRALRRNTEQNNQTKVKTEQNNKTKVNTEQNNKTKVNTKVEKIEKIEIIEKPVRKRPKLIIAGIPKNASNINIPGVIKPSLISESDLNDDGTPNINIHKKKDKKAQQLRKLIVGRKRTRDESKSSLGISKKSCSEYLNKWQSERKQWKFVKVRQTWLLQHMYNDDKVSDEDFQILVNYLGGLKGIARDTTIEKAESLLRTADNSSDDEDKDDDDDKDDEELKEQKSEKKVISPKQQSRAKDILQILS